MDFTSLILAIIVAYIFMVVVKTVGGPTNKSKSRHWNSIPDQFKTYPQLQEGLRAAGLESSNLILGIDFTKSNEWTGKRTFVIRILGKTLEAFDDDKLIPTFGFGDVSTSNHSVFPFFPNKVPHGFEEALHRYTEIVPRLTFSGPTNFAPLIREAIKIVRQSRSYHILVIIADGQVTDDAETTAAIVEASNYPLSIVLVGVGDGPWDQAENFDDGLPARKFDNFQFVNFHELMTKYDGDEVTFALNALMEIPDQFMAIKKLNLWKNC